MTVSDSMLHRHDTIEMHEAYWAYNKLQQKTPRPLLPLLSDLAHAAVFPTSLSHDGLGVTEFQETMTGCAFGSSHTILEQVGYYSEAACCFSFGKEVASDL